MKQNIEDQILTSIFNLMRIARKRIASHINTFDLTMLQIETLFFLNTESQSTMAEIAQQLQISKPTATIHLERLVQLGLATRKNQSDDRRLVMIELTPKGKKLLASKLKARKVHTKKLLNCLSEKEKETILKIFTRLLTHLEKNYEKK